VVLGLGREQFERPSKETMGWSGREIGSIGLSDPKKKKKTIKKQSRVILK
jgi:hypothetical protein